MGALRFGSGKECRYLWMAELATCRMANVSGLALTVPLDVIELAASVERFASAFGFGCGPEVVEVTPQIGLVGCLA